MTASQYSDQQKRAASELAQHFPELSAQQVVDCLSNSLTRLRTELIERACDDVETAFGQDSMILSSLREKERQTRRAANEIDAYCCILTSEEVVQCRGMNLDDSWLLDWLLRLRFGSDAESVKQKRIGHYESSTIEERRMKFVSLLHHCLPESARAPLVLFRLFPRAVRIATAMAFGYLQRAQALREEQIQLLPAIGYCHECHGRLMDCDDSCRCCGNPIWTIAWLQAD